MNKYTNTNRYTAHMSKSTIEDLYLKYYPPLGKKYKNKKRYLLDVAVDPKGTIDKSDQIEEIVVNGHVPWPWNSPFLQIIEIASNKEFIDLSDIETFFECGTSEAQTAVAMSNFFNVETVEALPEVYELNKGKKGIKYPINFHLGHGPDKLKEYLIKNPDERLLILLDDHDPDLNAWVEEELIIIKRFSNRNDHVIILDDLDHCGIGTYPYSVNLVVELCQNINSSYEICQIFVPEILPLCKGVFIASPSPQILQPDQLQE